MLNADILADLMRELIATRTAAATTEDKANAAIGAVAEAIVAHITASAVVTGTADAHGVVTGEVQ